MSDIAPVEVKNEEPIPVTVARQPDTPPETTARTVAAKAGVDADVLRTEDQRRISGIWERTQQLIALSVIATTLGTIMLLVWRHDPGTDTALAILFGLANLVIGFYFGRTNHTRVGGVGPSEGR